MNNNNTAVCRGTYEYEKVKYNNGAHIFWP